MNLNLTKLALFTALTISLSTSWLSAQERYRVSSGDSLGVIGQRFNVPYQDIMAVNGLENTTIFVGQELIIPIKSRHTAGAHTYPQPSNKRISAPSAPQAPTGYNPVPPAQDNFTPILQAPPVVNNPKHNEHQCNAHYRGSIYVVERGDTVRSISKKFGVAFWDLRTENDLWLSLRLTPGTVLKIPTRPSTIGVAY